MIFRCCCGCGKGKKSSSGDSFTTAVEVVIMSILVLLATLCTAWFFSANNYTFRGADDLAENLKVAINDTELFIDNTAAELKQISGKNFDEFLGYIDDDIDEIKANLEDTIVKVLDEINFDQLTEIANYFNETVHNYQPGKIEEWTSLLNDLNSKAQNIDDSFESLKDQICALSLPDVCDTISAINFDVSILPSSDVLSGATLSNEVLEAISSLNRYIESARNLLNDFSNDFGDEQVQDIRNELDKIGDTIKDNIKDITDTLTDLDIISIYDDNEDSILEIQDYIGFAFYGFLTFGLILVFVLVFYVVGMSLGSCGSTGGPAKKTGGCCLCTGSVIFFLISSVVWLMVTVFFLIGSLSDHFVCETLADPSNSELGSWIDEYANQILNTEFDGVNMSQPFNLSISNIIDECRNDSSLYNTFELDRIFDLEAEFDDWETKYGIEDAINSVKEQVDTYVEDILDKIDISQFEDQINQMNEIFKTLEKDLINKTIEFNLDDVFDFNKFTEFEDMITGLGNEDIIAAYQEIVVGYESFNASFKEGQTNFQDYYNNDLQFQGQSISQTVTDAFELFKEALKKLQTDGDLRVLIDQTVDVSTKLLIQTAQGFIDYITNYVENDFASCKPIMGIYDLFDNTVCYRILTPFNGIWTGVGMYLILMVPILIMSCMLEPLFRRYKKPAYVKNKHVEMTGTHIYNNLDLNATV